MDDDACTAKAVSLLGESFPNSGASDIWSPKASFIFLFLVPCKPEFKLIVVALLVITTSSSSIPLFMLSYYIVFVEIGNCLGLVA
jgi:hypothetical protein